MGGRSRKALGFPATPKLDLVPACAPSVLGLQKGREIRSTVGIVVVGWQPPEEWPACGPGPSWVRRGPRDQSNP